MTCSKCGKTFTQATFLADGKCVSKAACKRRCVRQPQYDAASWKNPSYEQMMST